MGDFCGCPPCPTLQGGHGGTLIILYVWVVGTGSWNTGDLGDFRDCPPRLPPQEGHWRTLMILYIWVVGTGGWDMGTWGTFVDVPHVAVFKGT